MTNPAALSALAMGQLDNLLAASTPGGIERQEAEGQRALASSFKTLPKEMDRDVAEAFGFKYTEDGGDDIFAGVEAPAGWSIRPTDHSMHSDILDDQGRTRGSIFYKAAFYDRRADGRWASRYQVKPDYDEEYTVTAVNVVDIATGEALHRVEVPESDLPSYKKSQASEEAADAWLAERFPDHRDARAYW